MTLQWPWGNNPVKYNPISTCLLRLGVIRCNQCVLTIRQNITSVCLLDNFFHIRQHWHKDEGRGRGWKTLQPLCYPCNLSGVFLCRFVLGSRSSSSEHNVSRNNENQLFSVVLSWFHLAVTLRWSHHDLVVTPLWNKAQPMSSCGFGLGFDRFIRSPGPIM